MSSFRHIIEDIYILEVPFGIDWTGIVFIDGSSKILIDSGSCAERIDNCLIPALKTMGYSLDDIDYLCSTHCHGDHVGGHKRITELSSPKVVCYWKSVPKLRDPMKYSKLIRAKFPEDSPLPPPVLDGVEAEIVLDEGDVLDNRLKLISTPGHDTDSVCYFDIKTKTLLSGDSLQGNGTASQGLALYMDLPTYRKSLKNLTSMDIENIIASHLYTRSGDKAIGAKAAAEYINTCRKIIDIYDEFIRKQMDMGETDARNIARKLIADMGGKEPEKLFLPLYTVTEHIKEIKGDITGSQ
jgi:hydroxyacylglutathione hydrolase